MRPSTTRAAGAITVTTAALVLYATVVRPRLTTWGATPVEADERLPGDELVADPATTTTRAITIEAPAPQVWSWLVQIGTDRGGWYTYDRLERLAGVPVHSTDTIEARWQDLAVGDEVTLAPKGWMGLTDGFVMPVADLRPGASIVLRQEPPRSPWDGVWSFHVRRLEQDRTRLVIRSRTAATDTGGPLAAVAAPIGELITATMEHGMLEGIKRRCETS